MTPSRTPLRDGFVAANGLRFHVVQAGASEAPLVVLLHGFPEFWYSWRHQIPALAEAGFLVAAPDLRGYNTSDKPAHVRDYGLEKLAADVAGLIASLGRKRAFVVGHDWGGAVAWHLAMHHPQIVERLAVLACPHPADMVHALVHDPEQRRRSLYMLAFQVPFLPERLLGGERLRGHLQHWALDPRTFSAEDLDRYVEAFAQPGAMRAALNYYRAAFRSWPRNRGAKSPPIEAPTMVLWGAEDVALGVRLTENLSRRVQGPLHLEVMNGLGHFLHEQAPGEINRRLIDFLKARSP